jgi:hypothetical protein
VSDSYRSLAFGSVCLAGGATLVWWLWRHCRAHSAADIDWRAATTRRRT